MSVSESPSIRGISSMATKAVLAQLVADFQRQGGPALAIESVGGVDAARRVQGGERFDVVVLAADAIAKLIDGGHLQPASRVDLLKSAVAVAVPAGAPRPDIGSEAQLRQAVLAARSIGFSTGPSGNHLRQMFERWGVAEEIAPRTVVAPPGVPVGSLVARGEVSLGFQQLSELMHLPGIQLLGELPAPCACITTFSAAIGVHSLQAASVRAWLDFVTAPASAAVMRQHGMDPA